MKFSQLQFCVRWETGTLNRINPSLKMQKIAQKLIDMQLFFFYNE